MTFTRTSPPLITDTLLLTALYRSAMVFFFFGASSGGSLGPFQAVTSNEFCSLPKHKEAQTTAKRVCEKAGRWAVVQTEV